MEFGRVTQDELEAVVFALPPDKPETTALLARQQQRKPLKLYVGCAKWGRKDWVGKIYPKGTKEANFLSHYGKFFNTIELNATFYKLPSKTQTASWKSKVPDGFQFCPKFSDKITHIKRLKDAKEMTDRFLEGISGFGETLGPSFLMTHPTMGPKSIDTIAQFLESIPKDFKVFVELRHQGWYNDPEIFKKMFDVFEHAKAGSVITDASGRRDCVHMRLTRPEAFIRFVGNGLHPTDYTRVDEWVDRIKTWSDQGLDSVYFFMHQHEEIHSPELSKYVIEQMNKVCRTNFPEPRFLE
jgi:uncharacterized protein YecE (DUF72 family)